MQYYDNFYKTISALANTKGGTTGDFSMKEQGVQN
jgi:hypothetical protein